MTAQAVRINDTMQKPILIAVLCSLVVHSTLGAEPVRPSTSEREIPMNSVLASDLFKNVAIVGSLGVPLWKVTTVRGKWHDPGVLVKDQSLIFRVTDIDGRHVETPIEFRRVKPFSEHGLTVTELDGIKWDWRATREGNEKSPRLPTADETWELVVFETGRIVGFPKEGWEVLRPASSGPEWGLITELQYLRMRQIK